MTRDGLHALACYAVAPARKARTGRIGLTATGDGFATPALDDGSRIVVRGNTLAADPGGAIVITTVRAAAAFLGIELSRDPGVGHDLPPFEPDAALQVDAEASEFLGHWFGLAQSVLEQLASRLGDRAATISDATLWPEHFDLAVVVELVGGVGVNVGFSPGDSFVDEPYVYVGPHDMSAVRGEYWNAAFGAYLPYSEMEESRLAAAALDFLDQGFASL